MVARKLSSQRQKNSEPDLLSDVLAALRVDSSALYIFDFHEPWGVELDDLSLSISWTVMEGTVWMRTAGTEPVAFHRGDTFLLPRGADRKSYVLAPNSDAKPVRVPICARDVLQQMQLQGFESATRMTHPLHARWGGRGRMTRVVSAAFDLNDRQLGPLIAALPELIVVRAAKTGNELIDVLLRLALDKDNARQPGFSALVTQTAQLLLVHVIRTYALSTGSALGWLAGLRDVQIARALACLHRQPECDWSVMTLARTAGLSRSQFAERFNARVGQTPMQYLRAWRMHLAREKLADGNITVTALAQDLGYQSEAAFRAAFRRITGQSPREFRRHAGTLLPV